MKTKNAPLTEAELAVAYAEYAYEMWMRTALAYGALDEHTRAAFLVYDSAREEAGLDHMRSSK